MDEVVFTHREIEEIARLNPVWIVVAAFSVRSRSLEVNRSEGACGARSKRAPDPKPLFAKLPISLHVALQELATKRLRKSGIEIDQKELLAEAIQKLVEAEGIDLPQIEADVSKWNPQQKKLAKISTIHRRRGRKPF